ERAGLAALDRAAGAVADAERRGQGERAADRAGLRDRQWDLRRTCGVGGRGRERGVARGEGLVLEPEEETRMAGQVARHRDPGLALERQVGAGGAPEEVGLRRERRGRGGV